MKLFYINNDGGGFAEPGAIPAPGALGDPSALVPPALPAGLFRGPLFGDGPDVDNTGPGLDGSSRLGC